MRDLIQHKNYKHPYWSPVNNTAYRIGPHTFEHCGVIRINNVEYNADSTELRKAYGEACEQREMWGKLNAKV